MADHDDEPDESTGEAPEADDTDDASRSPGGEAPEEGDTDDAAAAPDTAVDDTEDTEDAEDGEDTEDGEDAEDGDDASEARDASDDDGRDRAEVLAVYASARLVDTDVVVGAISFDPDDAGRELQDGREISGWSVFAGEETDEELEDAERLRLPSLAWVLQRDPAVALVTSGHDGSAGYWARHGERDDGLPNWVRVVP